MELIVKVNGGLGNQLFQYATGRALADRTGSDLLLDLSFFDLPPGAHTARPFALGPFNARWRRATPEQLAPYFAIRDAAWRSRFGRIFPALFDRAWYAERGFPFDPRVLHLQRNTYLDGHWQSERYFMDEAANIRTDLAFVQPPDPMNLTLMERIQAGTSVSLHVRRGDYVTHASANSFHGVCDIDYYRRAIAAVSSTHSDATFFVLSDDIAWCRAHLPADVQLVFVEHNIGASDHEDLRLMAACHHHIIANSSFSWWGAWLNPSVKKMVVAPKRWFTDPTIDTSDLIPAAWTRL